MYSQSPVMSPQANTISPRNVPTVRLLRQIQIIIRLVRRFCQLKPTKNNQKQPKPIK